MARRNYGTQWAGQFGVAHELMRRGYLVSFTMGNAPGRDLLCVSPKGKEFSIQVKSLRGRGLFLYQDALLHATESPYIVFVMVPKSPDERPEYFVMNNTWFRRIAKKENARRADAYRKKHGKSDTSSFTAWDLSYRVLATSELPIKGEAAWNNLPR